jgi:FtsP/CotA-like multicopper oxidase with cupredoxin domain
MGGMDHDMGAMDPGATAAGAGAMVGMQHRVETPKDTTSAVMSRHEGHDMSGMAAGSAQQVPGSVAASADHAPDNHGVGNVMVAQVAQSRLHEPGLGLGNDGWRVLRYTDLRTTESRHHLMPPEREIELHLTGNMERYMWSIDGRTLSQVEPIPLRLNERIRLIMVNDTMMNHPMHLHGMWMELENGTGTDIPKVHTINVKPAERVSLLVTADAPGPWAFHCHILYHMDAGMFRIFQVGDEITMESGA